MGNVLVEEQTLENIADSIRINGGITNKIKPADMSGEIGNVYDKGYADGESDGYDVGWDDAWSDAYDVGYEEGLAEGKASAGGGETIVMLPPNLTIIESYEYEMLGMKGKLVIPSSVEEIHSEAFGGNTGLTEVVFKGMPQFVAGDAFIFCDKITTIKVPWFEDDVMDAPWGAVNATIVYEYTED